MPCTPAQLLYAKKYYANNKEKVIRCVMNSPSHKSEKHFADICRINKRSRVYKLQAQIFRNICV